MGFDGNPSEAHVRQTQNTNEIITNTAEGRKHKTS